MLDLVLPDTNIWLDIVRARAIGTGKNAAPTTSAADAAHLSQLVAQQRVEVGVLHIVRIELQRNHERVIGEARSAYRETRNRLARLQVDALSPTALSPDKLLADDDLIYEQLLAQASRIDDCEADRAGAEARYAERRAPAHKGNPKMHDSHVLEAALRLARDREPGTTWLVTRNTTEFESAKQALLPQLKQEYDDAGLEHARNLRQYLGVRGYLAQQS